MMGSLDGEAGRSEGPVHEVVFARPFAIGRTEVTVREFRRFVEATGYVVAAGCRVQAAADAVPGSRALWQDLDWDYGTEPLPKEAWVSSQPPT